MGISLDGLSSGLDTTTLINTLMQAEAAPQDLLKTQVSSITSEVTALQSLNNSVATLGTAAKSASQPGAFDLYKASSSSTALTVGVSTGAGPGELQVVVSALARSQVGVSAAMATWPSPSTITIVGHSGTSVEISPDSNSLDDVVSAINSSTAGVFATKVASGTDPGSGSPLYRLQFSSKATGADGAFTVYQGSASDVSAGTATNVLAAPGSAIIRTAQDAAVTLWAGSTAEQTVTSKSNTFADILPGVTVTVSAVSTDPVTISVVRDDAKLGSVASGIVDALNNVFAIITNQSAISKTTAADGTTKVSAGVFAGDGTVRDIRQKILDAASLPVNGHSPSEYGISVTSTGTMTYDATKFAAALAADPTATIAAIQAIATRLSDTATVASDKYTGTITSKITGDQSSITRLGTQIADWDLRLASRKATLQLTYSSMEVTLSNLKAQQANLTSQLASLSTGTSA